MSLADRAQLHLEPEPPGGPGRGRALHGADPGRGQRVGHRRAVPQDSSQRQPADARRPRFAVPGQGTAHREVPGGEAVRCHAKYP